MAQAARTRGLDAISARDAGRLRRPDHEQLRWAGEQGRCFVSRDVKDFPGLSIRFEERGWPHAGVILVPRSTPDRAIGAMIRALELVQEQYPAGLPSYMVLYLVVPRM